MQASAAATEGTCRGHVRGYDVRTGKRVWIFHTIPRPGEFGNETWENDSWSYTGNTGVWAHDVGRRRARLRLPAGRDADQRLLRRPSARQQPVRREPGVPRRQRPASASGTSSSFTTGSGTTTSRGADPARHHRRTGSRIKAVAQVTKQAFTYVFDRATGQPVWPIEERPVPQSDVPGEKPRRRSRSRPSRRRSIGRASRSTI